MVHREWSLPEASRDTWPAPAASGSSGILVGGGRVGFSVTYEFVKLPDGQTGLEPFREALERHAARRASWEGISPGCWMRKSNEGNSGWRPFGDRWGGVFPEGAYFVTDDDNNLLLYQHWIAGQTVRFLAFLGDGGWLDPEGNPEPWEVLFWSGESLRMMEEAAAEDPASAGELRSQFAERRVRKGAGLPSRTRSRTTSPCAPRSMGSRCTRPRARVRSTRRDARRSCATCCVRRSHRSASSFGPTGWCASP